ncbi:MAG: hypothetical protein IJB94_03340 [Clostridia bacterium]|nr:hypothetical protein [Clostridia bacterium]
MKKILKTAALFGLLTLVLLATVSCKNILGNLPFLSDNSDTEGTTPSHSHAFGDWQITHDATCTKKGQQERTCSCGEKEIQEIAALGHTEVVDSAVAPSCTTDGLSAGMHCSVCGEILLQQEVTPAAHVWAQTELISYPTCFTEGEEHRVCRTCGVEETAPIEPLEHNFVQDEETKLYSCTICDARIFAGHLYAAIEGEYHWFEAYQACEDMGGHLVTITSKYEQEMLNILMNSEMRTKEYYYIGLVQTDGFYWITGESFEYQNWEPNEPDFWEGCQYFVWMFSHLMRGESVGKWNDIDYQLKGGFVCEWELDITECAHIFTEWETTTEATCWNDGEQYRLCTYCGIEETEILSKLTHNFTFVEETGMTTCEYCQGVKYNDHIYVLLTDTCSWFDAYAKCTDLGGHLATITSEQEQTFITSYLSTLGYSSRVWVGGYAIDKQWYWITGEPFDYANFAKGQPEDGKIFEMFLHINYNNSTNQWNDFKAQGKYAYLCEFDCEE